MRRLIWVYIVCSGVSVRTLRVTLVCRQTTKVLMILTEIGKGGLGSSADQGPCQRMLLELFSDDIDHYNVQ